MHEVASEGIPVLGLAPCLAAIGSLSLVRLALTRGRVPAAAGFLGKIQLVVDGTALAGSDQVKGMVLVAMPVAVATPVDQKP